MSRAIDTLIVFGQECDPHISRTLKVCGHKFKHVHFINYYDMPKVTYCISNKKSFMHLNGHIIEFDEPSIIWNRMKPCFKPDWKHPLEEVQSQKHWKSQWIDYILGLNHLFNNSQHYNSVDGIRLAENKLYQLYIARTLGFVIPDTLIGNDIDPIAAASFQHRLFKPLTSEVYIDEQAAFASIIDWDTMNITSEEVAICPAIYQLYEEKDFELRTFAFGDRIMSVKIDSQKNNISTIDWRLGHRLDIFTKFESEILDHEMIVRYLEAMGIKYGVFDFIVQKDGEIIFLECNPDGQWLGYSDHCGMNAEVAFADMLCERINGN